MARFYVLLVKGMFMPSFLCLMCYTPNKKWKRYTETCLRFTIIFNYQSDFGLRKQSVW